MRTISSRPGIADILFIGVGVSSEGMAAAGLCLMGYGVFRGEMDIVFEKAVRICMECIGLG